MSPSPKDIRKSPSLENLYKDLHLYMKELDKEATATSTPANTKNTEPKSTQPPFSFKIAGALMDDTDASSSSSATIASTSTARISCSDDQCHDKDKPPAQLANPATAFLSELSKLFVLRVKALIKSRNIFCSTEYPKSFTGQEAVDTLILIIGLDWSRKEYRDLARLMMHIQDPALFSPIAYSYKSLNNNTLYDSPNEAYSLGEGIQDDNTAFTQSLIMPLMDCYTPLCIKGASNGCYAPTCPNRGTQLLFRSNIINKELQRNMSLTSSMASSQDTLVSRCWSNTVSREVLQKTSSREMKRQEAIYEMIYTEEDYVRDLNLLDELFAKPLVQAQCIELERRQAFCNEIFGNYAEIAEIHRNMYRDLRDHQLASQEMDLEAGGVGFVDEIGSIVLRHVDQFMHAYTTYGPHFILAEYAAKREAANNILFQNFIREKEKQAETRKLPFRHFIILPITRLQRYPLLLDAILKRTVNETEKQTLTKCIEGIRAVASIVDSLTAEAKKVLRLREINDKIRFKPNYPSFDLDLLNPGRQLVYEGSLKRRSHLVVESVDIHVFLFDHLLLMTRPKCSSDVSKEVEYYMLSKNPIPLSLLVVNDVAENFIFSPFRSTKGVNISSASTATLSSLIPSSPLTPQTVPLQSSAVATTTASIAANTQYINQSSLNIRHLGRHGGEYILYTETPSSRLIWKENIIRAQSDLALKEEPNNAFKVSTISDAKFAIQISFALSLLYLIFGSKGMNMVALGTQQGIWMGKEGDTNGLTRVLTVNDVTQIGVLESQNIFLVLADKALTAYPLTQLDPTSPACISTSFKSKKTAASAEKGAVSFRVLGNRVSYFNSGTCNGRTLIVAMKRKGPDSHFKAYEPICGDLNDSRNAKYLVTKSSFMSKPASWFKICKEFYIGTASSAVHFLKSKLLVACSRGFEIIDLDHLSEVAPNLPDLKHRDFHFIAADAKPLNIFRCNENFLVCYDKFAFMITTHGDYVKEFKRIDWEGHPHAAAYHHPYVLAFDHRFIEIHHVETGKLVQVVVGDNTRLLTSSFNNTNTTTSNIYGLITHQFRIEYQHIFKLEPLFSS
ncbi:CNH domain-containing protein [Parasitella parasitica]|nr:CNH domain-containing protein [Parasitella parasitica]